MMRNETWSDTEQYQSQIYEQLSKIFGRSNVKKEWDVAKASRDDYTRNLYCPRIDLAVGPFNIDRNVERNMNILENACKTHERVIRNLFDHSRANSGDFNYFLGHKNTHGRCLLAVEIENSGTRKHMLGDIVNSSIIGAIGIVVPLNNEKLKGFIRLHKYLKFATSVGKTEAIFNNVLIIDRKTFLRILSNEHSGKNAGNVVDPSKSLQ
jgi:hypothetical protein